MSRILLASLAVSSALLATGCPLAAGCGAYDGNGDKVYQRGSDMLIVCTNGGYTATVGATTHEGLATSAGLTEGATGAIASGLVTNDDLSVSAFGGDAWQQASLDQTALDHADALCADLATRAWWSHSALEAAVAFLGPVNSNSKLTLCPDGTSRLAVDGETLEVGTYAMVDGTLHISQFEGEQVQDLTSELVVGNDTWIIDEPEVPSCK